MNNNIIDFTPVGDSENNENSNLQINDVIRGLSLSFEQQKPAHPASIELAEVLSSEPYIEQVGIDPTVQAKIDELQTITRGIDKRLIPADKIKLSGNYKINYRAELNPQQLAAVAITDVPLLVIAGAGSGKTRVITYKVSYLIESGINPSEILLLTFTKKAANEMIGRVQELLAEKLTGGVLGGTFHSFANHILRKYAGMIGIPNNFSIIDPEDSADIIDLLKTELNIKGKKSGPAFPKKSKVQTIISKSRNLECTLKKVIENYFDENLEYLDDVIILSRAYDAYKKASSLMDYDDLMIVLRDNLLQNLKFRAKVQDSINYILVDEYQDTNTTQREIVELIAGEKGRITVVGDDSQSIYAFRGANFENILRFPQSFSNCGVVKIEENYRSEQGILNFTNDIIDNAKIGFKKKLFSQRHTGRKPIIKRFADATAEAEFIVDKVLEIRENGLEFKDFAVLTRASWHSNFVQAELMKRNIPFVVYGGIKFSERRHVKDIVSFIKITLNPLDAIAWHRILKLIEGVGNVRAREIVEAIHKSAGAIDFSRFKGRKYYPELKGLEDVFRCAREDNQSVVQVVDTFFNYYKPILKQIEDDYEIRLKDFDVFRTIAGNYDDMEKFIADFTIEPPSNKFQDETTPLVDSDEKPLVVSTIHSAKGLEWHTVFVPFALDGLLPSARSIATIEEVEEERRLFYVACTRAKENLFITMPAYISSWDSIFTLPCRFLFEINNDNYIVES